MDFERITEHWNDSGLVVIPGFLDRREISDLRGVCDHVLQQAIAEAPDRANASNIAFLTERRYFRSSEAELLRLLEFIADQRIVTRLSHLAGELPLFHNTQYFYNPADKSWDGDWHRDTQFLGGACDYCPPPPLCFTDQDLRARLSPGARSFFEHFIKTYRSYWTGVSC